MCMIKRPSYQCQSSANISSELIRSSPSASAPLISPSESSSLPLSRGVSTKGLGSVESLEGTQILAGTGANPVSVFLRLRDGHVRVGSTREVYSSSQEEPRE